MRKPIKPAITLSAKLSRVLSGTTKDTPDGRDIVAARQEARNLARERIYQIRKRTGIAPAEIEIYACKRYDGALLDVFTF